MKTILIQGNILATYIGRKQISIFSGADRLTDEDVKAIFSDQSYWTSQ